MRDSWNHERIERCQRQLRSGAEPPISVAADGWLAASWAEGPALVQGLSRYLGKQSSPLKSHPEQGMDLFHDLLLRERRPERVALRCYDRNSGWKELTYGNLLARALRLSWALRSAGVKAGQRLLLALPVGEELLVALGAGLRIGARLAVIPPAGRLLFAERVRRAKPDFAYTRSLYSSLFAGCGLAPAQLLLDEPGSSTAADVASSHTFAPEDEVMVLPAPLHGPLLDALHGDGAGLLAVDAKTLWQGLLRDLVLCFALAMDEALAAPGSWTEQYQPGLLLTTLLGGATYVHIELEDLTAHPQLLKQTPIHLMIVGSGLRELLTREPRGMLPKLEGLLRDPLESVDLASWQLLRAAQGWEKLPIGNLVYESAAGGCVLFSGRVRHGVNQRLLPVPGQAYALLSPSGTAQPTAQGMGTYAPKTLGRGFVVIARNEEQLLFAGTQTPRRCGRLCPETVVLDSLLTLNFVEGAAVAPMLTGDGTGRTLWILVVHTGPEPAAAFENAVATRQEAIRAELRMALGPGYLPDEIVLLRLPVRRVEGAVDREFIRNQYQSGVSQRKLASPLVMELQRHRADYRQWLSAVAGKPAPAKDE